MANLLETLKRIVGKRSRGAARQAQRPRRHDMPYADDKEFRDLPPERVAELVGHPPERRD
jgi:hypothetical protein